MLGIPVFHYLLEFSNSCLLSQWCYLTICLPLGPQFSSVAQSCPTLCDPMNRSTPGLQARLSITNSQGLLKLMSINSVMSSSHLILCHPLLLLPPIPPSIRVFSNESTLHMRWPKYWSFSFSISPSKDIPGLISFRMDCLNLNFGLTKIACLWPVKHTLYTALTIKEKNYI